MKYRWLKIAPGLIWGTNNLTKEDLARAKTGGYDYIIDLENNTVFEPENNEWVEIKGDA